MQRRGANELDRAAPGIRRRVVAFAAVLVVLAAGCGSSSKDTAPTEKVLLIGDSIMDQEGGAAALALRQAGVDAEKIAFWGSGLLTADQYDHGKTRLDGPRPGSEDIHWLSKAKELVAKDRPRLVVVSMNHNLHSPYPTTADGREIKDPASPEAHVMIQTQVRALLEILRKHSAKVAFVTPPPDKDEFKPEDNPIWRSIKPVLDEEHIPIIDIAPAVSHNGARVEALPDCFGREQKIRRINEPHYERFGAGLAGTALADGIAKLLGEKLDNGAPGEHPVALVSTESGEGYWIVQCDGSVFQFGDAPHVAGDRSGKSPIVGAVRNNDGLWLVRQDGSVFPTGAARDITFEVKPAASLVAAAGTSDDDGILGLTRDGKLVSSNGDAPYPAVPGAVSIAGAKDNGVWRLVRTGVVDGVDGAPTTNTKLTNAVAIAPTTSRTGFWAINVDGQLATYGDAQNKGDAVPDPLPPDVARLVPQGKPLPVVTITASPNGGYWIMRENGKVLAKGAADVGGTEGLALFTP